MLFSQLDDFDHDVLIGDAASSGNGNFVSNSGPNDEQFTVINFDDISTASERRANVQTPDRCPTNRIDMKGYHCSCDCRQDPEYDLGLE